MQLQHGRIGALPIVTIICLVSCTSSVRCNSGSRLGGRFPVCTCAGTKQPGIHKTCAVTLTGKRPPNRDPELQRTELVQDTKALMVQDTKTGNEEEEGRGGGGGGGQEEEEEEAEEEEEKEKEEDCFCFFKDMNITAVDKTTFSRDVTQQRNNNQLRHLH